MFSSPQNWDIAITGIGCRFPGADSRQEFWALLQNGIDAITDVPAKRSGIDYGWDCSLFDEAGIPSVGGFLTAIEQFDANFFGLSPKEAVAMDPRQRLLLEVVWEALEDAGEIVHQAGSDTGVFIGAASNDYGHLVSSNQSIDLPYRLMSQGTSLLANRISAQFDFQGPSITLNTACSSSLVAVHQACQSLRLGECSLAVVGGVNLLLSSTKTNELVGGGLISRSGCCRSFDAQADGYVRAEGVGVVILKSLASAQATDNPIYGLIQGSAVNHNGRGNGFTSPNPNAQKALLRAAYQQANIRPQAVQYVEAHCSGTLLGDALEIKALQDVLMEGRKPEDFLTIGSVKTNIGNTETASGIAALIKVALALQKGLIPPSLHFQKPNPYVTFDELFSVQADGGTWRNTMDGPIAGVTAFGLGGTNAHVVLQGVGDRLGGRKNSQDADTPALFVLSAKSELALRKLSQRYLDFLTADSHLSLINLCYTVSARRSPFNHRLAVVVNSVADLGTEILHFLQQNKANWTYNVVPRRPKQGTPGTTEIYANALLTTEQKYKLLENLAESWLQGIKVNWEEIYASVPHQFIPVPHYAFDHQPYWIAPVNPPPGLSTLSPPHCLAPIQKKNPDRIDLTSSNNDTWEKTLALAYQGILGCSEIDRLDNFFDLGGNSLLALQLVNTLNEQYNLHLSPSEIFLYPQISQLALRLSQSVNPRPSADNNLIFLRSQGEKNPIFAIHTLGISGEFYRPLIDKFALGHPLIGLNAQFTTPLSRSPRTVEFFASQYVDSIINFHAHGPYCLVGFSIGGLVAFEVANQLLSRGKSVELLILIDTEFPTKPEVFLGKKLQLNFESVASIFKSKTTKFQFQKSFYGLINKIRYQKYVGIKFYDLPPSFMHYAYLGENIKARKNYQINGVYPNNMVFIKATTSPEENVHRWRDHVAGKLIVHEVEGSHLSILKEPNVETTANILNLYF